MLIIALVLALIGLAALVFAVVTSNALVAWVCIGASLLGVVLLIIDALQARRRRVTGSADDSTGVDDGGAHVVAEGDAVDETYQNFDAEYPEANDEVDESDLGDVSDDGDADHVNHDSDESDVGGEGDEADADRDQADTDDEQADADDEQADADAVSDEQNTR